MSLAPMQRMSDYLHHCGQFVGITKATLIAENKPIGDVAVNISAIALIREAAADSEADAANG